MVRASFDKIASKGEKMRLCMAMIAVFLIAAPVAAQPSLYRVVNVASDDVLNIRSQPSAGSALVGAFSPGTERVEVLAIQSGWGRVVAGEGMGWVNLAYMEPMDQPRAGDWDAPGALSCGGTEPFWGATIGADGSASFYDAYSYGENRALTLTDARTASARPWPHHYSFTGAAEGDLVVDVQQCSDGMSDRDYPWRAYLYVRDQEGGPRFMEGCCRTLPVAPN